MPHALPITPADPSHYRDRKKALWLLSVLFPLTVLIGPGAYLLGHTHALWFFAGPILVYGGIPLLDAIFYED